MIVQLSTGSGSSSSNRTVCTSKLVILVLVLLQWVLLWCHVAFRSWVARGGGGGAMGTGKV